MKFMLSKFLGARPAITAEDAAASLERGRQDAKWRWYDWPACGRIQARSVCAREFGRQRANRAKLILNRAHRFG